MKDTIYLDRILAQLPSSQREWLREKMSRLAELEGKQIRADRTEKMERVFRNMLGHLEKLNAGVIDAIEAKERDDTRMSEMSSRSGRAESGPRTRRSTHASGSGKTR